MSSPSVFGGDSKRVAAANKIAERMQVKYIDMGTKREGTNCVKQRVQNVVAEEGKSGVHWKCLICRKDGSGEAVKMFGHMVGPILVNGKDTYYQQQRNGPGCYEERELKQLAQDFEDVKAAAPDWWDKHKQENMLSSCAKNSLPSKLFTS